MVEELLKPKHAQQVENDECVVIFVLLIDIVISIASVEY